MDTVVVSFSGGKTSGLMAKIMKENYLKMGYKYIIFLFANTAQENEKTLRFVDKCDKAYGLGVVWLEAEIIHRARVGTKHKVVTYKTASRNGEPFEEMIKKFGIPNKHYPHCTRELKQRPIYSYLRSIGLKKGDYHMAIGIRYDEMDRLSSRAKEENIIYPLFKMKVTKEIVNNHWEKEDFTLEINEHQGNCKTCWKKSFKKLEALVAEDRSQFCFFNEMEERYPYNGPGNHNGPRRFFRGNRSTKDILSMKFKRDIEFDLNNGCGDSCEVFADD